MSDTGSPSRFATALDVLPVASRPAPVAPNTGAPDDADLPDAHVQRGGRRGARVRPERFWRSGRVIVATVYVQIVCQLALLVPGWGPLRVPIRVAALATGLLLLVAVPGRARPLPAAAPLCAALAIVLVAIVHPTTSTLLSGIAQFGVYCAVASPVFWVARLGVTSAHLRRMFVTLWAFGALSATVGVLQVHYPGRFATNTSTVVTNRGAAYLRSLHVKNAAGASVFRPSGLTDTPGGAAAGAFAAVVFGIALLLTERRAWMRTASIASVAIGATCLYLSQVRAFMVVTAVCCLALATVLIRRGRIRKLILLALALVAPLTISVGLAVAVGGGAVSQRLNTLGAASPKEIYDANRGQFLTYTVTTLLPRYPLGAGLGRWGMINEYFGEKSEPDRAPIWAEIQLTGWLLDGGVPLVLAYACAMLVAITGAWKVATARERSGTDALWLWGAVVFAYDIGAVALTFDYPLFAGDMGVQFWVLNAAVYTAFRHHRRLGGARGARAATTL